MNSYQSLSKSVEFGTAGTEMDVQLTKDNVLVLFHHKKLEESTSAKGIIKNLNWNDLEGVKYKTPIFSKVNLIRADYFFDQITTNNSLYAFDCKVEVDDSLEYLIRFSEALTNLISKYNLVEICFIESYNLQFLKLLYEKNNRLKLFVNCGSLTDGIYIAKEVPLYGLTINKNKITKDEISEAHKHNLRVALYNANTKQENLEAVEMSPDFIQTDDVEYLLNVLKKE